MHNDHHAIAFSPSTHFGTGGAPTRVYVGQDGGIATSPDGTTWTNINETLATNLLNWIDIGHTPDYWRATQMILKGEVKVLQMPGRPLAPGVWAGINLRLDLSRTHVEGPVFIGSSTAIEPGAHIVGPTVIGRNCVVESGARIRASVVGGYTRVSGFADLTEKIVSGRFCVDTEGRNVDLARTGYAFVVDDARERRDWSEDQQVLIEFLKSELPPG